MEGLVLEGAVVSLFILLQPLLTSKLINTEQWENPQRQATHSLFLIQGNMRVSPPASCKHQ